LFTQGGFFIVKNYMFIINSNQFLRIIFN